MKILYHHRTQAEDGQAVHIRALQQAFREQGHEVREVALVARAESAESPGPAQPAPAGQVARTAQAARAGEGSKWGLVTRLPRFARELAEYCYTPVARPKLLAAAREQGPDFIYERYAFGNAAGVQAARRLEIPLVLEVNSPMVLELENTRGLSFPGLARKLETSIFTRADLVCVVTGVLREMLIELGVAPERLIVTPNGVHPQLFASPDRAAARRDLGLGEPRAGEVVLGFVGYYRDWHRLDLVIAALAREDLAHASLVLIGEGPAHADLMRAAEQAGVAERVHFTGARPHDRIPGLLPAFDLALVPAINPYASPLKLFEYMAAGLAVIAPDQPNLREVLGHDDNALLVPSGDGEALAQAIVRLAGDADLRGRLGTAAQATVGERDLTWRGNARRVIAAVEALG